MRAPALVASAAALLAAAACAPADQAQNTPSGQATPGVGECGPPQLKTREAGNFTLGTDQPAYEPWFNNNEPSNGQGFESAVAYAVTGKLGYPKEKVKWVSVPFNAAIQPGPKPFDADINQFSISDERKNAVDFSVPYYDVRQAVIAMNNSPATDAESIAGLKSLTIGAQVGTTSYEAITKQIQPDKQPAVYNTNDEVKLALNNGQVQAAVFDLPTAFYITSAELTEATIVGQLPRGSEKPEQFGIVLDKGSPLTRCVSAAVEALRTDGTLSRLEQEWLAGSGTAPELK